MLLTIMYNTMNDLITVQASIFPNRTFFHKSIDILYASRKEIKKQVMLSVKSAYKQVCPFSIAANLCNC